MCLKPAFCAHRLWRNSSFYQEVQRSLCDYRDGGFPWTTRLHQILFQVRENSYRMLWNFEDSFSGTKTQSSQWKNPGSPRPKNARQVRSNIKSVLICFFDQKRELFTKNLFLPVKQLMLHSTSNFWNVYGWMCEGSDLISGGTTHGCSTMTMCQPKYFGAIFNVNFNIVLRQSLVRQLVNKKTLTISQRTVRMWKKKKQFLHHNAGQSLNDSMIHQFKIFSSIQTSSYSKKGVQTLFIHGTVCLATGP